MNNIRIIARLDIKGPNLVKGIHLEGLRVLGKPEDFARYYYENGADELIYQDVVASLYNRNSLTEIISRAARSSFIPLTVGGGLRTIDDIKEALRIGADKVAINTAAIQNPMLIEKASKQFGASTIVVVIEALKHVDGAYLAFTDNGREFTGVEVVSWAKKVEELGAGEILLTSIDKEGTGEGFDLELIEKVSKSVSIPVIAHGGAGKLIDFKDAIDSKANALAVASMIHYDFIENHKKIISRGEEGNIEFLMSGKTFSKIKKANIRSIKSYLADQNIQCRNTKV